MSEILNPNERLYVAKNEGQYLSTRILNHGGTTIAFALGKKDDRLFFDYSILNASDADSVEKDTSVESTEKLDSECWFENPKQLLFPSEIRSVGEEADPVYKIRAVDHTGRHIGSDEVDKLDVWSSTTLSLMDPAVSTFEVLSDGKYVYLFRQSRANSDGFLNELKSTHNDEKPPTDSNLLCDRFTLVESTLNRTLEVRYQRSRQKRLPLDEKDTLGVQDVSAVLSAEQDGNDVSFYEPTFSVRFVQDMVAGRFTVVQTPTVTNGVSRWMIFAYSKHTGQIECFTSDVSTDGLFDIHGRIYYTCNNGHHETFSTAPGICYTPKSADGVCQSVKRAIVPKRAGSEWSLLFTSNSPLRDGPPTQQIQGEKTVIIANHMTDDSNRVESQQPN